MCQFTRVTMAKHVMAKHVTDEILYTNYYTSLNAYTQRIFFGILLIQTKFGL